MPFVPNKLTYHFNKRSFTYQVHDAINRLPLDLSYKREDHFYRRLKKRLCHQFLFLIKFYKDFSLV